MTNSLYQKGPGHYPPLIEALCDPAIYPHKTGHIRIIETHISWVLLTGLYVYKIKKPVKFAFLDFSSLAQRQFFCQEELRLNRRLAADLYLGLIPITGTAAHPQLDGTGEVIEYAIKMAQFPSGQLLSERAKSGQLASDETDQLADIIAGFHATIERANQDSPYGDSLSIKHWAEENFDCIRPLLADGQQLQQLHDIQAWGDKEWQQKSGLMQLRKQQGYVRECHGDLHLNNITLIDSKPVLFDCIEFNAELRWIDVINEIAFLLIDLLRFGYGAYAYRVLNRYLQITGDYQGLGILRYYLVYRALVRAKLALLRLAQQDNSDSASQQAHAEYALYATLAGRFIQNTTPALIITHGYSGSGKSLLANQLAGQIGAIQIRSDIERKRLFGYHGLDRSDGSIYSQAAGEMTYQQLAGLAQSVIAAGFTAIVDAAFLKSAQRDQFRQLANDCGTRFIIIDVQASEPTLYQRVNTRQNDASEATTEVLQQQLLSAQALSANERNYAITANTEIDSIPAIIAVIASSLR